MEEEEVYVLSMESLEKGRTKSGQVTLKEGLTELIRLVSDPLEGIRIGEEVKFFKEVPGDLEVVYQLGWSRSELKQFWKPGEAKYELILLKDNKGTCLRGGTVLHYLEGVLREHLAELQEPPYRIKQRSSRLGLSQTVCVPKRLVYSKLMELCNLGPDVKITVIEPAEFDTWRPVLKFHWTRNIKNETMEMSFIPTVDISNGPVHGESALELLSEFKESLK